MTWRTYRTQTDSYVSDINTYTKTMHEGVMGAQYIYPDSDTGVTIVSSATAWTFSDLATIIPLDAEASDFHVHHVNADMDADGEYQLKLYRSDASVISDFIGSCVFDRETNKTYSEGVPINCGEANATDAIRAKLASENAAADEANIKLSYHRHA